MIPKQETFDTAVRGLLLQAKRSVVPGTTDCRYRAPDGSKCAAGHCISDEEYRPEFEGYSAYSLFHASGALHEHNIDLVQALQRGHDLPWLDDGRTKGSEFEILSDWPRRFREIATKHELSAAVVDELEAEFLAKIETYR